MERYYYTLQEAMTICNKYQYLIGKDIDLGVNVPIHFVAISPVDLKKQDDFLAELRQSHNPTQAFLIHSPSKCDVLIIHLYDINSIHRSIRDYAKSFGIIDQLLDLPIAS